MPAPAPQRYVYGAQMRSGGRWLWPRGCYEYDLEKAQAAALRTWPYATKIAVAVDPAGEAREAWVCERDQQRNLPAAWILVPRAERWPAPSSSSSAPADRPLQWWQRD